MGGVGEDSDDLYLPKWIWTDINDAIHIFPNPFVHCSIVKKKKTKKNSSGSYLFLQVDFFCCSKRHFCMFKFMLNQHDL